MNKELQDLAWSVLPKEFKEEVKKLYSRFLFTREGYYDELFGKHNLTSDADGEEELLHVTRQKVMGLYANAKKLHDLYTSATCINTTESQQIDICTGTMSVLTNLFGSKCLPDEHKECSNPSVVNCRHKHGDGSCSLDGMCYYKSPNLQEPKSAEPGEPAKCDKQFDNILKDSFSKERRLNVAAILYAGALANQYNGYTVDRIVELADALIAECEKADRHNKQSNQ